MLAGSKIRTISTKVKECGNDTKILYNLVNNITGRVNVNPMPPGKSYENLAEELADYFLNKINKIRDDPANCPTYSPSSTCTHEISCFNSVTEEEVKKQIRSMPTKSCDSDTISKKLFKQCIDKLGPVITSIVNLSLTEGKFTEDWKSAIVRTMLKNHGQILFQRTTDH